MQSFFEYFQKAKTLRIFLLFAVLSVILRFFSFFPNVIDHDESTYLEIARMILGGKLLYVDMIDIKPPGIFLILAGFEAVFGYSIFVMRLLHALCVAITALLVFKSSRLLIKDERASIAAGIIYIFCTSSWSFYGVSITPEIFFNLFTISALYILLKKQSLLNYLLAGLLGGLGFVVKYLVLLDFAAFMIFFLFLEIRKEGPKNYFRLAFNFILAGIGFILPFALVNLIYYLNGHFDALYNIVYLAPSRYPAAYEPWRLFKYIFDFHLHFLPIFFFFYFILIDKKFLSEEVSLTKRLSILWFIMALIAVLIAGKAFGHYTIQLMLPVSITAGIFFHSKLELPSVMRKIISGKTGKVILLCLIVLISLMKLEYFLKKDVPREIAAYLEPRLKADDVIYCGNYHHIIYYLLKKDSPTKYVHRTLLLGAHHIKALDINADEEFRQIIAQKPVYIIIEKDYPEGIMKDFIMNNYKVEKEFGNKIYLYRYKL